MSFVAHTTPHHSLTHRPSQPQKLFAVAAVVSALLFVLPALGFPAANAASGQTQMQLNEEACRELQES